MSVALIFCPCLLATATVVSLIVLLPAARKRWTSGRRTTAVLMVPAGVVLADACAIGLLYLCLRSHAGFGLGPADRPVVGLHLPSTASDVNYWRSPHLGTRWLADFAIGEADFLAWARSRGWNPEKFTAESARPRHIETARERARGGCGRIDIRNGYYLDTYEPPPALDDSGWTIIYDLERGRAYLRETAF